MFRPDVKFIPRALRVAESPHGRGIVRTGDGGSLSQTAIAIRSPLTCTTHGRPDSPRIKYKL